jgi:hypothetical protein
MPSLLNWQQSCLPGYLLTLDDAMRWAQGTEVHLAPAKGRWQPVLPQQPVVQHQQRSVEEFQCVVPQNPGIVDRNLGDIANEAGVRPLIPPQFKKFTPGRCIPGSRAQRC